MIDPWAVVPSSVLAFVTTIHAALVVLRLHRGRLPRVLSLALPSVALTTMPWVLPTWAGVGAGLAAHVAWFAACEWLAPVGFGPTAAAQPAGQSTASVPVRPAASVQTAGRNALDVRVLAVHRESAAITTFRFERPPGFDFQAGQFLTVRLPHEGRWLTRCYSISSPPEASGYLEISVKRQGLVSGLLHATLLPGSTLAIRPPAGPFVYPAGSRRPLVLLAGGIGITPLLSMLRHAILAEPWREVTLLYSVRSHDELAFADELSRLARRHPQVRVAVTVTGDAPVDLYRHGRIDAALLADVVPDLAGSLCYLCGPLPMIDALRGLLERLGVPPAHVHAEAFAAAIAAAGDGDSSAGRVTFRRSGRDVESDGRESLLELAERAGIGIPSLCRAGSCGTCRTRLVSGDARSGAGCLGDREREQGWILPCITQPAGDCVLEA